MPSDDERRDGIVAELERSACGARAGAPLVKLTGQERLSLAEAVAIAIHVLILACRK